MIFEGELIVQPYMYEVQDNVFFHSKQRNSKQSQNHQLDWTDLPQHRPVGNQTACHTEICIDQAKGEEEIVRNIKKWQFANIRGSSTHTPSNLCLCLSYISYLFHIC